MKKGKVKRGNKVEGERMAWLGRERKVNEGVGRGRMGRDGKVGVKEDMQ